MINFACMVTPLQVLVRPDISCTFLNFLGEDNHSSKSQLLITRTNHIQKHQSVLAVTLFATGWTVT